MPASPQGDGQPATPPTGPPPADTTAPTPRDEARLRQWGITVSLMTVGLVVGFSIAEFELWHTISLMVCPAPLAFSLLGSGRPYRTGIAGRLLAAALVCTVVAYAVPRASAVGYAVLTGELLLILLLYRVKRRRGTP
jgi:hypothetical protein